MLLHPAVEGEADAPPASPVRGDCWLVGSAPTGAWEGGTGKLATYTGQEWQLVAPRNGMSVLVIPTGQVLRYVDGWQAADPVAAPSGGTVIDVEARAAITAMLSALTTAGALPQS